MSKFSASLIALVALGFSSAPAYAHSAHHIVTNAGKTSFTVEGDAGLGASDCRLVLSGDLRYNTSAPGGHPHTPPAGKAYYNEVYNLTGTNLPLGSPYSATCAAISIVGGDGRVTDSGELTIDNLLIKVGANICNAGPVIATASNSGDAIEVAVDQFAAGCGAAIYLDGLSDTVVNVD